MSHSQKSLGRRASLVWKLSPVQWNPALSDQSNFKKWWSQLCGIKNLKHYEERIQLSTYILWWLWRSRNLWLFERVLIPELKLVEIAMKDWQDYCHPLRLHHPAS